MRADRGGVLACRGGWVCRREYAYDAEAAQHRTRSAAARGQGGGRLVAHQVAAQVEAAAGSRRRSIMTGACRSFMGTLPGVSSRSVRDLFRAPRPARRRW